MFDPEKTPPLEDSMDQKHFTEALREALDARQPVGTPSKPLAQAIALLEVLAVQSDVHPKWKMAKSHLAPVLQRGTYGIDRLAYDALVQLGIYSSHEYRELRKHGRHTPFSDTVLEDAAQLATQAQTAEATSTALRSFAIDDAVTSDVDDAIAIERSGDTYIVHILIADVASAVPLDSPTGQEALERVGTLYLPDRNIPMMPACLSEDALSLSDGQPSRVLDFQVELTAEGEPIGVEVVSTSVQITSKLTYDQVDSLLTKDPAPDDATTNDLRLLQSLASRIRDRRRRNGAVIWQPHTFRVRGESDGSIRIDKQPNDSKARNMISEYMILAGTMAAEYLTARSIPAIYRVQDLFELHIDSPLPPSDHADIFERFRQLRPAKATLHPGGHGGLGVPSYVQVTSPIRRAADYLIQLQLTSFINTGSPLLSRSELQHHMAGLEAARKSNQRIMFDAHRSWILRHYEEQVGRTVRAEVIGIQHRRVELFLLDTGFRTFWSASKTVSLGQRLDLRISQVDHWSRRLFLKRA